MRLAGDSNEELATTLAAASSLSRAAAWELRRPIDEGHIFDGRELGRVLWSHTETFAKITKIPAEMTQSGTEPPLAAATRARLFSVAHNALTNAVSARPCQQSRGPAGLRHRLHPAVGVRRRGRLARRLRRNAAADSPA